MTGGLPTESGKAGAETKRCGKDVVKGKTKDQLSIGVVLAVVLVSGYLLFTTSPRLGLDLRGGMNVVLTARPEKGQKLTEDSVAQAQLIVGERVNGLGVTEPVIERQVGSPNIIVQLPGIKDPNKALSVIGRTATLEFREVLGTRDAASPSLGKQPKKQKKPTLAPDELLDRDGQVIYKLASPSMTGKSIQQAQVAFDSKNNQPQVNFTMTSAGAAEFEAVTRKLLKKQMAIVLDNKVWSAPTIQSVISGGSGQITGTFSLEEVKNLVLVLNTGALPVSLDVTEQRVVGPTLGADALRAGLYAGLVGLAIVAVFMLVMYRGLGLISIAALGVFGGIFGGELLATRATLTLPGIAGIIMTIGLAADSSIVFFERFREEIRHGKTARSSAGGGFTHAFRTIIDADAVSVIIAITLIALSFLYFGPGPVRGFALTLTMGIVADVATAFFFTRPTVILLAGLPLLSNPLFIGVRKEGQS